MAPSSGKICNKCKRSILLLNLIQVTESISGSVVPLAMFTSICVTASKRDGGVLSEQDIATWVEELVPVINVEQNDGNVDNVYIAINVDQNDRTWQCLPILTMLTMPSMLSRTMARASACQG